MKKIVSLFFLLLTLFIQAQEQLSDTKGTIVFEASVPLFEEVKAINEEVLFSVEIKNGEINSTAFIKNFKFKRDLMRTHFNENYLESHRYPKATFIGRINKFDYKFVAETPTEYQIKGILKIHGKSKPIICSAWLKKIAQGIELQSTFVVNTDDFNIEIPTIVASKISKQVSIHLKTVLKENN
jgi:hypothetical protein